jgi:Protein of unknown function (DUF742)
VSHWTDDLEQEAGDDDEPLVRPYTITGGRTVPEHDGLTLITVITSAAADDAGSAALQPEHRAIIARCVEPIAIAEIAAELDLPVSVTKILVADLAAQGRVTVRAPLAVASGNAIDMTLLQEVRNGLANL